jgi:hypothetical protein
VAYAALMLWQKYHSVLDIVATAAVMLSLLMVFWWLIGRRRSRLI